MLGRKILETFTYDGDADVEPIPSASAPSPTGLTLRRVKSKTLCIVTEGEMMSTAPLANRTNKPNRASYRLSSQRTSTPDTSHTFGRPNPTTVPSSPDGLSPNGVRGSSAVDVANLKARRQLRYSGAQRELETKLRRCSSEPSPQDLQIRALQRATDLLGAQARDAQQRVAQLRERLVDDRALVEPADYCSMQHECWMEARRGSARDEQTRLLHAVLSKMSAAEGHAPDMEENRAAPRMQARRKANLASFFERSPTRTDFPQPRTLSSAVYRRNTISHVRTMRLRTSAPTPALTQLKLPPVYVGSVPPVSPPVSSGMPLSAPPNHRIQSGSSAPTSSDATSVPPSPIDTVHAMSESSRASSAAPSSDEGFASIYASSLPRSRAELAAGLKDVSLPTYAVDLLNELGADSLHTLRLRRPPSLRRLPSLRDIADSPIPPPSPATSTPSATTPAPPPAPLTAHIRTQSAPHPRPKLPLPRSLRASLHLPQRSPQRQPSNPSLYSIVEADAEPAQPHPPSRPHSTLEPYATAERGARGVRTFVTRFATRLSMGPR